MRLQTLRLILLGFVITGLLLACTRLGGPIRSPETPASTSLLIAAAASLQPTLQTLTPLYTQANPNQRVNYTFAASGALQQQIEQGAPVDVFISAAAQPMQALQTKGLLLSGTPKNLLTNQLALITPRHSPISLMSFQELVRPQIRRISVGEPRSVPVGQYAIEVFKHLNLFEQVQSKLIFANNVRAVLTAVETGAVEAGVVYLTDANGSNKVEIATLADQRLHSSIVYPIAILKASRSIASAQQYVEFLQSDAAQTIFARYGFGLPQS
jgi:molybdate transport system substrate-binding protein